MIIEKHRWVMGFIPDMKEKMREAQATSEALSHASGVGTTAIKKLMQGKPIRVALCGYVEEALQTKKFKYRDRWEYNEIL